MRGEEGRESSSGGRGEKCSREAQNDCQWGASILLIQGPRNSFNLIVNDKLPWTRCRASSTDNEACPDQSQPLMASGDQENLLIDNDNHLFHAVVTCDSQQIKFAMSLASGYQ